MRIEMYTKGLSFYFFWSYAHFDKSDSNSEKYKKGWELRPFRANRDARRRKKLLIQKKLYWKSMSKEGGTTLPAR